MKERKKRTEDDNRALVLVRFVPNVKAGIYVTRWSGHMHASRYASTTSVSEEMSTTPGDHGVPRNNQAVERLLGCSELKHHPRLYQPMAR
jgi:hypothetical protein